MFVGSVDDLGDLIDARNARDEIKSGGDALKMYQEVAAGHSSFMIGKDMTYVDQAMKLTYEYNPLY